MKEDIYIVPGSRVTGVTKSGRAFKIKISSINPYLFQVCEERSNQPYKGERYPRIYVGNNCLEGGNAELHRVMAITFLPPKPLGAELVRHINDNPSDNRLENLTWGTHQDNADDREENGNTSRKLSVLEVEKIISLKTQGVNQKEIAKTIGVSASCISQVLRGKRYGKITGIALKPPGTKKYLSAEKRLDIAEMILNGKSEKEIKKKMKTSSSTITQIRRELSDLENT